MVRRECLDWVIAWPGETLHTSAYGARKVGTRADKLLEAAEENDPHPTWQDYRRKLQGYGADLQGIRQAVLPAPPTVFGQSDGPAAKSNQPPQEDPDGPCHPYAWRRNGQKLPDHCLQRATWNLIDHLRKQADHTATFDELAEPVFGDHALVPGDRQVGLQRSKANDFFKKHHIPWKVATSPKDGRVWLEAYDWRKLDQS